ncbi:hypothetical protein C8A01DRAFT_12227 [Parachaetomium inaequale]|uniref:Uncharacterized protein n=1 Tax=Parachaetomium inaequale TaxID=2588326 RepID=A0AAN6PNU5_9PEZI|nr:hypothetical protein C8A01DRAFT_12227 [Parachaetomium inaequale]
MEYTRHSSQPATVDLVRADLAEIWTVDESENDSPRRPPSVSGVSDMLDLEYIPTPGFRPSKAMKRDPLPEILGDFLELSPTRKGGRNGRLGKQATDHKTPAGPSKAPRGTQPGHASHIAPRPSNANKRKKATAAAESPVSSPASRPRERQPNGKTAAKASKQAKALPAPAYRPTTRTRTKAKRDDDLFELSDVTDTESESRPKKRQAKPSPKQSAPKQPSPKEPRAPPQRKVRVADKEVGSPVIQRSKPTRVPKKPSGREAPRKKPAEAGATITDTATQAYQEAELDLVSDRHVDENTSPMAKPVSSEPPRRITDPESTHQRTDTPEAFASPEPPESPKPLPAAPKVRKPLLPVPSDPQDVITLSSESGAGDAAARSTSPMFMEQDQDVAAEVAPDLAISVNTGSSSDQRSPIRLPLGRRRLGFTPPPSFQPRALKHNSGSAGHALPANIRDAFFSDEQPAAPSPSPAPELEPGSGEESLGPENVWKQAVEDDSPPAILHRIVTLLHRSLKPREEVVRDIAADYQDNALRLLDHMSTRHDQEKTDTLTALRKASRASLSVFSSAGQDMAVLINRLRAMDVTRTADTLRRPALAQKLDVVAKLCQTKLSTYVQNEPVGHDAASESDDSLDDLAEAYQLKLVEAVRRSDDKAFEASEKINMQVDEFMKRCLQGETKRVPRMEARKPDRAARNADEALEVFLDGIINTLQENGDVGGCGHAAPGNIVSLVSEDSDMAEMDLVV